MDVRDRTFRRVDAALQPGRDRARVDASGAVARHSSRLADRDVSGGERLLFYSQLRNTHRRDSIRPKRDDPDWKVFAEPLFYAARPDHNGRRRGNRIAAVQT